MRYPALPAGAFIAAFLILIPASWIWRAGHIPTLSLIAWLFTLNIVYGANSLVWSDDAIDRVPIWCDISTKLIVGASIALPACTFRLCKHLAMIGGNLTIGLDRRDRRRIAIFDFGFCWGIPVIFMALHYVVQGHRYNIIQYFGCQPTIYVSIPGIFIIWVPPLLLSIGSSAYAGIALYYFVRIRRALPSVLQASSSPMSINQYMRLIAMSVALMFWSTVFTSLKIWANTLHGLRPWISWEHVHSNWNRADAYVWISMSPRFRRLTFLFWWEIPVSSVIPFIFLSFGEDALKEYRRFGEAITSILPPRALSKRDRTSGRGISPVPPLPPSGLSFDGSSAPLLTKASGSNQMFQELPPIQFHSLSSMIGLSRSRTQSESSGKSYEWWSLMGEKLPPVSSELDNVGRRFDDYTPGMGTMTIAEPREVLTRGSAQEMIKVRESHDQV